MLDSLSGTGDTAHCAQGYSGLCQVHQHKIILDFPDSFTTGTLYQFIPCYEHVQAYFSLTKKKDFLDSMRYNTFFIPEFVWTCGHLFFSWLIFWQYINCCDPYRCIVLAREEKDRSQGSIEKGEEQEQLLERMARLEDKLDAIARHLAAKL